MNQTFGTFYAVGVGPGDPALMTIQAVRLLERCPVIAAPQTGSGEMLALKIACGAADLHAKQILPLRFTMSQDKAVRLESYKAAAAQIEPFLKQGMDVAMVNLGDVSIYATAYYLFAELQKDGFPARMCPGVTSFSAVAAALGCSLTEPDAPLHIIPGTADLEQALTLPGTKVLMKSGSALSAAVAALERHGMLSRAALVADCGLPTQQVFHDLRGLPEKLSYFATIIVRGEE